jgi:uncharacterized protein (DUF433 family)
VICLDELLERITVDPDVLVGKPVIRRTRILVYLIVELVAHGVTAEEILKEYPRLKEEDIKAALLYASKLEKSELILIP